MGGQVQNISAPHANRHRVLLSCIIMAFYFLAIHSSMLIWDFIHQDVNVFLNCDRANTRLIAIKSLLAAINSPDQDVLPVLARLGIIGDYLFVSFR